MLNGRINLRSHRNRNPLRVALFTLPLLLTGTGALIGASFSNRPCSVNAASWTPNEKEKQADHSELVVTATSSTLTSSNQSITVSFHSKRIEAWANGSNNKNVYSLPRQVYNEETGTYEDWVMPGRIDQQADYDGHAITEEDYPRYDADVFNISTYYAANPDNGHIVIPSTLTNDKRFILDVVGISADACFDPATDNIDYTGIEEIVIPATIEDIEEFAFENLPDDVTIFCEAPEYVLDENGDFVLGDDGDPIKTYPGNWTDGNVVYDYELTSSDKAMLNPRTPSAQSFGTGEDFLLGIKSDKHNYPLYVSYQFEKYNEQTKSYDLLDGEYFQELDIDSTNNPYDAVGTVMGVTDIVKNIDIEVADNTRVRPETLRIHNIYKVDIDGASVSPRFEDEEGWNGEYFAIPTISFTKIPHFSEFFDMEPLSLNFLGDYLQWEILLTVNPGETGYGLYPEIRPAMYEANLELLKSGAVVTRYQFSSLDQAQYRFRYEVDGEIKTSALAIGTPVKYVIVPQGQQFKMGFLFDTTKIEGLSVDNVKSIDFRGFVIKSDIYDNKTHSIVTRSQVSMRFSTLSLFPDTGNAKKTNVALVIAITYIAYVVLFVIGSFAYYFYAKRRFRNDEFHRVNTKRFIASARSSKKAPYQYCP